MVIGGGGTSAPSNKLFFTSPQCQVITGVGAPDPTTNKRPPIYVMENAPWSAVRDPDHAYGFAAFNVDPGQHGKTTSITVTDYAVTGPTAISRPLTSSPSPVTAARVRVTTDR